MWDRQNCSVHSQYSGCHIPATWNPGELYPEVSPESLHEPHSFPQKSVPPEHSVHNPIIILPVLCISVPRNSPFHPEKYTYHILHNDLCPYLHKNSFCRIPYNPSQQKLYFPAFFCNNNPLHRFSDTSHPDVSEHENHSFSKKSISVSVLRLLFSSHSL